MENKNKKTLKDFYLELLAIENVASNNELVDFINGRIEILDKKNSSTAPSKTQIANEMLANEIFEKMELNHYYKCSELANLFDITTQKLSPILKKLVETDKVVRIQNGKLVSFVRMK